MLFVGRVWSLVVVLCTILVLIQPTTSATPADCGYTSSSVTINGTEVYVDGQRFYAQGIGYSPVPVDADLSEVPFGDFFTAKYKTLWERDLDLMRGMNATLLRVWSWNFINDHHEFLDALYNNKKPLRILIPFMMSLQIYKDLTNSTTRAQCLVDFEAFLLYNDHPAVFGYMIGNELDRVYGDNIDDLFSLVNEMKLLQKVKQPNALPITLPLSSANFDILLEKYYESLNVDFWSVQIYSPADMIDEFTDYATVLEANPFNQKPLLVTEFGSDSLDSVSNKSVNEYKQAEALTEMWGIIMDYSNGGNASFVFGGSVMEWCDEWWKGNVPDVLHDGCPDYQASVHSYCGNMLSPSTFVYEEWLGIFAQNEPGVYFSETEYCLTPRQSYYALMDLWSTNTTTPSAKICGYVKMKNPYLYMGLPLILLLCLVIIIEIRHRASEGRQIKHLKESMPAEIQLQIQQQQKLENIRSDVIRHFPEEDRHNSMADGVMDTVRRMPASSGDLTGGPARKLLRTLLKEVNDVINQVQQYITQLKNLQESTAQSSNNNPPTMNTTYNVNIVNILKASHEPDVLTFSQLAQQMLQQLDLQKERLEKLQRAVVTDLQRTSDYEVTKLQDQFESLKHHQKKLHEPQKLIANMHVALTKNALSASSSNSNSEGNSVSSIATTLAKRLFGLQCKELDKLGDSLAHIQNDLQHQYEQTQQLKELKKLQKIQRALQVQEGVLKTHTYRLNQYIARLPDGDKERLQNEINAQNGQQPQKVVQPRRSFANINLALKVLVQVMFRKYTLAHIPAINRNLMHIDDALKSYKDEMNAGTAAAAFDGTALKRLETLLDNIPAPENGWLFEAAAMRVENLIWDKIMSSQAVVESKAEGGAKRDDVGDLKILKQQVETVYYKYLEAYKMWGRRMLKKQEETTNWVDRLNELVLWNVVAQCAGTISHSPEKVCEVYHFAKLHSSRNGVELQFVESLIYIFKKYCQEIESHAVNFDDVNNDAITRGRSDLPFFKVGPKKKDESLVFLLANDSKVSNMPMRQGFFALKKCVEHKMYHKDGVEDGTCRYTPVAFPQRGGIFGAIVAYGWLIRINLWMITAVWFFLEHNLTLSCMAGLFENLAVVDSSICLLVSLLRFHVVGQIKIRHVLWATFYFLSTAAISVYFLSDEMPMLAGFADSIHFSFTIVGTLFDFYIPEFYLSLVSLFILINEVWILFLPCPFPVKGRDNNERLESLVWIGFAVVSPIVLGALLTLQFVFSSDTTAGIIFNYRVELLTLIMGLPISATSVVAVVMALVSGTFVGRAIAIYKVNTLTNLSQAEAKKRKEKVTAEVEYLAGSVVFWFCVLILFWVLLFHLLVPSVKGIKTDLCQCQFDGLSQHIVIDVATLCPIRASLVCYAAVVLAWGSAFLISFVAANACFNIALLGAGAFIAIRNRIGNVQRWQDVTNHFARISSKCFVVVSSSLKFDENKAVFWNHFVDSLYKEHLISATEKSNLCYHSENKLPDLSAAPRNHEARRRIIKFCWSLEAMLAASNDISVPYEYRKNFQVRTMPSWTIMVPCATETNMFSQAELLRPKDGTPRISVIEYLAATFPDEWENFARSRWRTGDSAGKNLLEQFLSTPLYEAKLLDLKGTPAAPGTCTYEEVEHVCFWASCRGQTLVRTIRGLINYREGLSKLAELEEGYENADMLTRQRIKSEVRETVNRKFQIIIALQIYNPDRISDDWTAARNLAFRRMLRMLGTLGMNSGFDLVFNCSDDLHSGMIRIPSAVEEFDFNNLKKYLILRPSKLIIGEPKAENQSHALAFAQNEVIQVNDMNMYNTLENAFKIPNLLNSYFGVPDVVNSPSSVIPPYRIVGFPESCYTRNLSMVGMLMASAEFCFVTITQRVLASLRVRAHYGHPDFVDGFWARTRGGVSKASHLVNTNEDIFAGYEIFGRGERVAYVEYVEEEKGRESGFNEAFTFEAKLAQGAAQQIRSREVYHLNNRLPALMRLSLFYGSVGFYITSMLMSMSIDFYIYAILFFAISGVSYHALGLLNAVISVPWIFQIGFVQAFPLLLEQMLQLGVWDGFILFLTQLPFGLVFFVFHLRTKSYFFANGLFVGKGGYKGTGRGFGLDRMSLTDIYKCYFESHFHNALVLLASVVMYGIIETEPTGAFFLRVWSILLVVFSWITAPIIFNPYATADALHTDLKNMNEWNTADLSKSSSINDIKLHVANSEIKENRRKDELKKWIDAKMSWQAWFIKMIIDEWEEEDSWTKGGVQILNVVKMILQKSVLFIWRYGPWFLIGVFYFRVPSLLYFASFVLITLFNLAIDKRYTNQHEHFTIWKASVLMVFPPMLVFFLYGNVTLGELIISICSCVVACFVAMDLAIGIYNLKVKLQAKARHQNESRDMLIERILIPRMMFILQRFWPFVCLIVLGSVNLVTVILSGGLTTLLFNGRVADMWNRAYLYQKQL